MHSAEFLSPLIKCGAGLVIMVYDAVRSVALASALTSDTKNSISLSSVEWKW
jgi:hypothetical protein